ncbi:MAG TPA: hypothetical protein GX743_02610 [Actinomycetales bacterium]|nr:hypothetical protein [Actinomycetales bacterium]
MEWREERTRAAQEHAAALERRRRTESEAAQRMLDQFTQAALAADLPTEVFVVRGFGGRGRARTEVEGWLLRRDGTIGLGTDGRMYRLTQDLSLLDRFRTVSPEAIDPPRVIGAGGRDGDSIALETVLDRLLPGWKDQGQPDAPPPGQG